MNNKTNQNLKQKQIEIIQDQPSQKTISSLKDQSYKCPTFKKQSCDETNDLSQNDNQQNDNNNINNNDDDQQSNNQDQECKNQQRIGDKQMAKQSISFYAHNGGMNEEYLSQDILKINYPSSKKNEEYINKKPDIHTQFSKNDNIDKKQEPMNSKILNSHPSSKKCRNDANTKNQSQYEQKEVFLIETQKMNEQQTNNNNNHIINITNKENLHQKDINLNIGLCCDNKSPDSRCDEEKFSQFIDDTEYFNLQDNKKLNEICQKVNFVRNSLSKNFGKLRRDGLIIENDSLFGIDQEINLTNKQIKQRDCLIYSLRRRSQIFLILNTIWIIIIALTYIESEDMFKMKTLDSLSINLLTTANGFTIMELILWVIAILVGLNGVFNFSIPCLRIYQVGIITTIMFEFLVNIILLNFVPLSFAKSLVLMLFHFFFIMAAKIVQNAMLAFRSKYIPILYHCQLNFDNKSIQIEKEPGQFSSLQHIPQVPPIDYLSKQQQKNYPAHLSAPHHPIPSYLPKNLQISQQKNAMIQYKEQAQQINNEYKQQQQKQQKQNEQQINDMQNIIKIDEDISSQDEEIIMNPNVFGNERNSNKKQVKSVIGLESSNTSSNNDSKKFEINSFPAYDNNQNKIDSDISPKQNQIVLLNLNRIGSDPIINLNLQDLRKTSSDALKIQRKGTTTSSIAQGSQTTLPSNYNHRNQNNPSQLCPNLDEIELNVDTL